MRRKTGSRRHGFLPVLIFVPYAAGAIRLRNRVSLVRIFISTFIIAGGFVALAMMLFPLASGRIPLTSAGLSLAFLEIEWRLVAIAAAFFAIIRVLCEFQFFRDLFDWVYVFSRWFR